MLGFVNIALAQTEPFGFILSLSGMEMSLWQRLCTEIGWQGLPLLILLVVVLFLAACNGLCLQQQQFSPPLLLDALHHELSHNGWHHALSRARTDDSVLARLVCLLLRCTSRPTHELDTTHHAPSIETELRTFWEQEQRSHLLRCRGLRLCAEIAPFVALLCLINPFALPMPSGESNLLAELQKNVVIPARPCLFWSCIIALTAVGLAHFFEYRLRRLVAETQDQALALLHQSSPSLAPSPPPPWQKNRGVLPWLMLIACAIWPHWCLSASPRLPATARPCFVLDSLGAWHPASGLPPHPSVLMLQSPHPPAAIELLIATAPAGARPNASLDALLQQAHLLGWRMEEPTINPIPPRAVSP